jgi:hypothetical protein
MDGRADGTATAGAAPGDAPPVLSPEAARRLARAASTRILDLLGVRGGRVTEPGPLISTGEDEPQHLFRTVHSWSVYDVPEDELVAAFERLRRELPAHHWNIVADGHADTPARAPELIADHEREPFAVNAELRVSSPHTGPEETPLILVTVVSGRYRAPEGTDLTGEF